ncbi:hypothetical protein [Stenotrophomonas maltophilia]|uniref:hypothetical protein n=1 Tax=Stenotrophomonas maltophilia TaxID=40324 RepID=UPI0039F6F008
MKVEINLENFVKSVGGSALCLHGPWGIGKTHLWRKVVKSAGVDSTYVSLFGVDSLDAMKAQISLAVQDQQNVRWWQLRVRLREVWAGLTKSAPLIPSRFGGGAQLAAAAQALAFYFVRDRLICIDDVERRGRNLSLRDVLGLVSHLEEQRSCRVCVILNSNVLAGEDKIEWDSQREKAFASEVYYDPSPDVAVGIAFGSLDQLQRWHKDASEALIELGIRNVRVIKRAARSLHLVFAELGEIHAATISKVAREVVFIVYCHCGKGLGAPSLEFLLRTSPMTLALDRLNLGKDGSKLSAEDAILADRIGRFDIDGGDALTRVLIDCIRSGFSVDALRSAVDSWDREARIDEKRSKYSEAWRRYRNDLRADDHDLIQGMMAAWPGVLDREMPTNVESFAKVLRAHGQPDLASEVIRTWVEARSGSRAGELEEEVLTMIGQVTDEEFLAAVEQARNGTPSGVSLEIALSKIGALAANEGDFSAVAIADTSKLAECFKSDSSSYRVIKELLERRGSYDNSYARAAANAESALKLISSESPGKEVRIRSTYGISHLE